MLFCGPTTAALTRTPQVYCRDFPFAVELPQLFNRGLIVDHMSYPYPSRSSPKSTQPISYAVRIDLDVQNDCSLDAGPRRFRRVPWCAPSNYPRSLGEEVGLRMERQTGQIEAKNDPPHEQIVRPTAGLDGKTGLSENCSCGGCLKTYPFRDALAAGKRIDGRAGLA